MDNMKLKRTLDVICDQRNKLIDRVKQLEEVLWAKDQLISTYRFGRKMPTDKVLEILYEWNKQKVLEDRDKQLKQVRQLEAENKELKRQIETAKKMYPFLDDTDGGDYTLKDGKPLDGNYE